MAENKEFYLVIKGEKVIVSEEVYRAYKSSDRAERKRKQRMWRCRIKREKGINNQWKRCQGNCEECQFKQQKMSDVSLDALKEEGFDGVDESLDVEANFIAREERKEMYQKLGFSLSYYDVNKLNVLYDGKKNKKDYRCYGIMTKKDFFDKINNKEDNAEKHDRVINSNSGYVYNLFLLFGSIMFLCYLCVQGAIYLVK